MKISGFDEKIKQLKIVSVEKDAAYAGNKVYVTVELPVGGDNEKINDLEQFFRIDAIKNKVIEEASNVTHKSTGWSDVSPLRFFNKGKEVRMNEAADAVQVRYTCLSMP